MRVLRACLSTVNISGDVTLRSAGSAQTQRPLITQRAAKFPELAIRTVADLPAPSWMVEVITPQNPARK